MRAIARVGRAAAAVAEAHAAVRSGGGGLRTPVRRVTLVTREDRGGELTAVGRAR